MALSQQIVDSVKKAMLFGTDAAVNKTEENACTILTIGGGLVMEPGKSDISRYVEKKRHGDVLLPFVIYGTMMPTIFTFYPLHCHEEVEMVLVDCGSCCYTISGNDVVLQAGDILVMMPWVLHSFRLTKADRYFLASTYLISLDMINNRTVDICSSRYFSPMLNRVCSDYCVIPYGSEHYTEFRNICVGMFDTFYAKEHFFELKLKSLISDLIYKLLSYGYIEIKAEQLEGNDVRLVRRVVDYISEKYMENITLAGLSELVNLSETGLSRLFRNITGMSCIDYVIEYRLTKAQGLLRTTDKPIIEVAYDTGFNNISYFNRTFKKHCGQTPSEFRRTKTSGK